MKILSGILSRQALEEREERELAPYAMRARESRGRRHPETEHAYRTAYQRDRDRIIHSAAFRRLEYKTQVFANTAGDYYRTRLTHTMEVAQIARTIARALGLNEDLTESIALAHDLGHGPFGHSGEDILAEVMADHGGFEHNRQALRIVDHLEHKYPDFPGLNLTEEVRISLLKHGGAPMRTRQMPLEAQVADAADRIAYNTHDLDDGLASGLLSESTLGEVGLWQEANASVRTRYPDLDSGRRRYHTVRSLIDLTVTDLLSASISRLAEADLKSAAAARDWKERLVRPSPEMERRQGELSAFLSDHFYNHYRVRRMRRKASGFLREMFQGFLSDPGMLPPRWREWADKEGPHRAVCDFLASMTDRQALEEYRRLFLPDSGTTVE